MGSAGPAPGEPEEQAESPGPFTPRLPVATLWKPPQCILVQFLIPNKSKKSSGSCYAIGLFCTKYIILKGCFMTS